jgi:hypothetical protein
LIWVAEPNLNKLGDFPQMSVGAPLPIVLQTDYTCCIAYICQSTPENWDGSTVRIVDYETADEHIAIVSFIRPQAVYFGSPNDEALSGHALFTRGLKPYAAFEVKQSDWIASLERMNRVHPFHDPERFADLRHFVLTLHDTTFECVAAGYAIETLSGSIASAMPRLQALARIQTRD